MVNYRGKPKNTIFTKKQSYALLSKKPKISFFNGSFEDRYFQTFIPVGTLYNLNNMERKGERYIWKTDVWTTGFGGYFWLTQDIEDNNIATCFPDLHHQRYRDSCTVGELKRDLDRQDCTASNEMLLCASLMALEAIFSLKDERLYRLAALHFSVTQAIDYGIKRPLLIIDGKSAAKEYRPEQIKQDLVTAIIQYKKWYWKLLHCFMYTSEYKLLLSLIDKISPQGIDVNVDLVINSFSSMEETSPDDEMHSPHKILTHLVPPQKLQSSPIIETSSKKTVLKNVSDNPRSQVISQYSCDMGSRLASLALS